MSEIDKLIRSTKTFAKLLFYLAFICASTIILIILMYFNVDVYYLIIWLVITLFVLGI